MKLLTFAHRGEAQTFLKNLSLKSHPDQQGLYVGDGVSVLITGEGIYETLTSTSFALSLLGTCTSLTNIGICGAVSRKIELHSIHKIRSVYAQDEFKSFSTNGHDNIDIITSKDRVLDQNSADEFNKTAELVDREAWANGYVAKKFNVTFECLKLVSDHITDADLCTIVKDKAEDFSDMLYSFYMKDQSLSSDEGVDDYKIFENSNLYFTLSQKRQYSTLVRSLGRKHDLPEDKVLNSIKIKEIESLDMKPKDRVRILLIKLQELLYPFKTKVQQHLEDLIQDISTLGVDFKFDKDLEKKSFQVTALIDSEIKQKIVTQKLSKFPWNEFEKIMNGDFDV